MEKTKELLNVDFRVGADEVIILIEGKPKAKIPSDAVLGLFDMIQGACRAQRAKEQDPYSEIRHLGVSDFVRVLRLTKKGLAIEQVSKITGFSDSQIRLMFQKGTEHEWPGRENEYQKQTTECHDYVKCRTKIDAFGQPGPQEKHTFLEVWPVWHLLQEDRDAADIAKALELDYKDFKAWLVANKQILAVL